jgi:hypothetical protein
VSRIWASVGGRRARGFLGGCGTVVLGIATSR